MKVSLPLAQAEVEFARQPFAQAKVVVARAFAQAKVVQRQPLAQAKVVHACAFFVVCLLVGEALSQAEAVGPRSFHVVICERCFVFCSLRVLNSYADTVDIV